MTTVLYTCGPYRSVASHTSDGPLSTTPTMNPNVAGFQRLPSDPAGTATVTFLGVPAGAEIRVSRGTDDVTGVESCVADQVLVWDVYSTGSPLNTVRILIVHMDYRIKDFQFTASAGSQTIPVQLDRDKWAFNPT